MYAHVHSCRRYIHKQSSGKKYAINVDLKKCLITKGEGTILITGSEGTRDLSVSLELQEVSNMMSFCMANSYILPLDQFSIFKRNKYKKQLERDIYSLKEKNAKLLEVVKKIVAESSDAYDY